MKRDFIKEQQDSIQTRFDIIEGAVNGMIIGTTALLLFIIFMVR